MRIAQVAPLFESVPPKFYGGTERVVHYLTEGLVKAGHQVTLYASGDSQTSAELRPIGQRSLRMLGAKEPIAPHMGMFEVLRQEAHRYDVIHFHNEYLHLPTTRMIDVPCLSTLHGRLDHVEYEEVYSLFKDHSFVSISMSQRKAKPALNWVDRIYHGFPSELMPFSAKGSGYLAFLGRITPEKRVEHAIEIARLSGRRLKVAAKIPNERDEYVRSVLPLLEQPFVEFVGEIGDSEKPEFLGGADALLFPIDWPEPFGLVMIESLAAGTPVIAFRQGSVPEVIEDGKTGFVVDSIDEAVRAVKQLGQVDRKNCRAAFENRFSVDRMVSDYVCLFERMIQSPIQMQSFAGSL
ncbi:MAG TPA: glycosyltransferase family 4 protein, partial [Bdellovibrionales bacterium]|nr:glycosyltransferase family 4 protein [Bdellovibrionales bacterium]